MKQKQQILDDSVVAIDCHRRYEIALRKHRQVHSAMCHLVYLIQLNPHESGNQSILMQ